MTTEEQSQSLETVIDPNIKLVKFDVGFIRGQEMIKEITLRKPKTHALRGLSLVNLLNLDIDTIAKVASRVTQPVMSPQDVYELEPSDITKLGTELIGFFASTNDDSPSS
ncbi:phage tail assembly protein [Acinetobacter sp. NIPH 1852]|uniref:phage tail assembly protein n=1 Tax=Acinetobacter sp. NIPH 1852 TaxID=2923428 RepID=UPI001F4A3CF0|nr:phage tail assembly protein [Acinetobacter sp. NIPH 1852]MCH7306599.1 phage tail assembly protein [Acinetobacter sp. NIPH 1852]